MRFECDDVERGTGSREECLPDLMTAEKEREGELLRGPEILKTSKMSLRSHDLVENKESSPIHEPKTNWQRSPKEALKKADEAFPG
jgi:hypothetical protein